MYKAMYSKVGIGGPEATLGTAVARTSRLPINGMAEVRQVGAKEADDVITGRGAIRGHYVDSIDVNMELPLRLIAHKGVGQLFVSALGNDLVTPLQVGGSVKITYTGASESCKLVVTADSITASVGDLGAEVADTNFDTDGTLSLTGLSIAQLVTAIDGYTGYTCEKLFGADATSAATVIPITTAQAAGNVVVVYATSADSGVYLHRFASVLGNTERPTYSFQGEGMQATHDVLAGGVVDSISISADLKGRASMTANVIGTSKETDDAMTLSLPTQKPMQFAGAEFWFGGAKHTFVKSFNLEIANNHDGDEGFGSGSLYKQDHAKGMLNVSGSLAVRTGTSSEVEYAKRLTVDKSSLFAGFQGADLATSIPEAVYISAPHLDIMDASKTDATVSIDSDFPFVAVDPDGQYGNYCTVDMITADSATYYTAGE